MLYDKREMYSMLVEYGDVDASTLDLILKVAGDTKETYIKVLTVTTPYKTFEQFEDANFIEHDM